MKTIHPAIAEHAMEESERLRGLLREASESVRYQMGMQNLNHESGRRHYEKFEGRLQRIDAALSQQAEPAPAQDERCTDAEHGEWAGDNWPCPTCTAAEHYRATHPAQTEQQPLAWLIDWPEEPELGHYFSDEPNERARSRPLYAARPAQTEQQPVAHMALNSSGFPEKCLPADPNGFPVYAAPTAQAAPQPEPVSRDWPDGNYYCKCSVCGHQFTGHKRQLVCRLCSEQPAQSGLVDSERAEAAFNSVITYMLGEGYTESPMEFLRCWNEGKFDALREEWPEAPLAIYYADSLADHAAIDAALSAQGETHE